MQTTLPQAAKADIEFCGFSLSRYRAFERRMDLELAPITVLIGANNSGKTTLGRAPWFISQPFGRGTDGPFERDDLSGEPAPSLLRVASGGGLSGFEAGLRFRRAGRFWDISYQATADVSRNQEPHLARVHLQCDGSTVFDGKDVSWPSFSDEVRKHQLDGIHDQVQVLGGLRSDRTGPWPLRGRAPTYVGFRGENAPFVLNECLDAEPLRAWSIEHLGVEFITQKDRSLSQFHMLVHNGQFDALLGEVGAGVVQILPVAVALLLLPRLPGILTIEHPELHLHPHAHRGAAELFIQARQRHPNTRFLIETHSDTFILRLRRAVVEERLKPEDVVIYTVSGSSAGAEARPIHLNARGVPDWWPKGVFAEAQAEFSAMRGLLAKRDLE